MRTSPSPKPATEPPRGRFAGPLIAVAVLAVLTVAVVALPASLLTHFLPPTIRADDFSGSLWHGSAGRIDVAAGPGAAGGRAAGAVEWHVHPWSLLRLTLAVDLHWVKGAFVADAAADIDRHGVLAHDLAGAGPLDDLADLGIAAGWQGTSDFHFSTVKIAFDGGASRAVTVLAAVGDVHVANLSSPQIAGGTDLGGYAMHVADGAITPDADATAELTDTGGPLELHAAIHFSAKDHTGLLSGTVRERADAPAALRKELENLTQMHARDAQGRIPVELEFTL